MTEPASAPQVRTPGGHTVGALGQGTWRVGEISARRAEEIAALRLGVELGMSLIDTAEMYGDGAAESLIGEAISGFREDVFLVSKAYPQNADWDRLPRACEASLKRLKTDRIDLYLLHWRGSVPLAETVEVMEALKRAGKVREWGVSNFDVADLEELMAAGGTSCAADQVLLNLSRRGPEFELAPWLAERSIPLMAYSPIEQGKLTSAEPLAKIARRHGVAPAQIALAWLLALPDVIVIPKAASAEHVRENSRAAAVRLEPEDFAALDAAFPPPRRKLALQML